MADKPNHEFLNPLRRADEARIARTSALFKGQTHASATKSVRPVTRAADASRQQRQGAASTTRTQPQAVRSSEPRPARSVPSTTQRRYQGRPSRSGSQAPRWLVVLALIAMAAGFAGAVFYLGSETDEAPSTGPSAVENWDLKGK
jgi:hypothetical protein